MANVSVSQSWLEGMERERQEVQRKLERQTYEIARLRAALKPFAEFGRALDGHDASTTFAKHTVPGRHALRITGADFHTALRALGEEA